MGLIDWALRLMVAIIFFQTLFFKFTGAPESVYIFNALGVEPWGRYLMGAFEAIAAVLILVPKSVAIGALVAVGLMGGALFTHLTKLGIAVQGDRGLLFVLALTAAVASMAVFLRHRIFRSKKI